MDNISVITLILLLIAVAGWLTQVFVFLREMRDLPQLGAPKMAADDEDLYLEAVESLARIASDEELPGDRQVVRNALEAFGKKAGVVSVEAPVKSRRTSG